MKTIAREMNANITDTGKGEHLPFSQASFNSHGCLTIRNYNPSRLDTDVIVCLNETETKAVFDLFKRFRNLDCLPF